jgi:hypothetical protein
LRVNPFAGQGVGALEDAQISSTYPLKEKHHERPDIGQGVE